MRKLKVCLAVMAPFLAANVAFSATLCGKVNGDTLWTGGVFSVINEAGQTIATTNYIAAGDGDCTPSFAAGTYLVRFSGAQGKKIAPKISPFAGVYGCLTQPYVFTEKSTMTVVFNKGLPPFNGDYMCKV